MHTIAEQLASLLKASQLYLVTVESCTGGLVAGHLTDVAGSSQWFERGFVTYSNLAKQEMLGVSETLIQRFGAVSEPVACAMAEGALKHSKADIAVAVTGIAGPDGGSIEKPVGTVWFAWALKGQNTTSICQLYSGNRQQIRALACIDAVLGLIRLLKKTG